MKTEKKQLLIILYLFITPCSLLFGLDLLINPAGFVLIPSGNANKTATGFDRYEIGGGGSLGFGIDIASILPNPIGLGYTIGAEAGLSFIPYKSSESGSLQLYRLGGAAGLYYYPLSRLFMGGEFAMGAFWGQGETYRTSAGLWFRADGVYTYRPFTNKETLPTIGAAIGVKINLTEVMSRAARVQIEKTQQHNIFPVSWAWYENNPIATVTVTNNEKNAITNVNLRFFTESYMSEPWTFAVIPRLAPGENIEMPVTALFNESLISLSQNVTANGILQAQYRSLGARKETQAPVQMPILQRNTMSWDDDRRAAAFVSSRDFSVMLFARNIASAMNNEQGTSAPSEQISAGNTPKNVLYAIAVFEALRLYRINYVVDPSTPYAALSQNADALDNIKFPYETLYYRGGECDDLSILLCSILEALGVETAFITVPGHIYAAFAIDSSNDADADNWLRGHGDIITINGKRWIPLESTVTGRGFTQGWQIGISQWREAGNKAELFPIRNCWEIYPSVTVPASADHTPEIPDLSSLKYAVTREAAGFNR